MPPTPTPLPATDTVCAAGCDFTTIQAAIDDPGTTDGAIIEITDPVHTEAGIIVNKDVTIRGLGADDTIVQAHDTPDEAPDRVFLVEEGTDVTLDGMTIQHGKPSLQDEHGGGIYNYGTLTLENCVVTDNIAIGGGGICNDGELMLINSTVSNNTAVDTASPGVFACGGGGGIRSGKGTLTLVNTTVSGNQAGTRYRGEGGGVRVGCQCKAVFTNSTISGNSSVHSGGGISVTGMLQLVHCTISDNATNGKGEGICVQGRLDYENTLVANNPGNGGDCAIGTDAYGKKGTIGTNSNNLVGDGGCGSDHSGDPMLGPLADNGGATWTHALPPDSPAVDAVSVISCTLPTDQRGVPRPIVQTSSDTPCDIGAFELQTE
jgi:predicted outer membrane repeat protein